MLEEKARTVLLLLILFSNERSVTIGLRRSLQRDNHSQNRIHLSRQYFKPLRQSLKSKTGDEKNFGFPSINRLHKLVYLAKNINTNRNRREISTRASAEPEQIPDSNPEPRPEWQTAIPTWGRAWGLHIYLFAVVYILIAVTSGVGLAVDVLTNHGIKGLKLALYLTFLFFGFSRAIILLVDPYNSQGILDSFSTYLTWSLGFPCVLTALGLLLLVFVDATNMMNIAPPRFQKLSTALGVMAVNVITVVGTDLAFLLTQKLLALVVICHVYFVFFGVFLAAGFFRVGFQLSSNSAASIYGDTGLQRLRFLVFITAVLNLIFIGTQVYSVFDFVLGSGAPSAWPWYAVQTSLRALEVSMCVVMLLITFNNRVRSPAARLRNLPNRFRVAVSPFRGEVAIDS
ncbi:uncharacterized protein LOC144652403 [Oculina patagonica]